jgi:hypothetical protein
MKQTKTTILIVLILSLLLAACGGGDESDEASRGGGETAVTNNETNETSETAVPLADEMRNEEGGFAFQPPVGYDASVEFVFAEMTVPDDAMTQINIIGTPFEEGMNVETLYERFASDFGSDDSVTLGERQPLTVNGVDGFSVTMEGDDNGTLMKGELAVLGNDVQGVFIFGGAAGDQWDDEVSAQFDAVVNSISLIEISAAGAENINTTETTETTDVDLVMLVGE